MNKELDILLNELDGKITSYRQRTNSISPELIRLQKEIHRLWYDNRTKDKKAKHNEINDSLRDLILDEQRF